MEIGTLTLSVFVVPLLMLWLGNRLIIQREKAKERREAAKDVHNAFKTEIDALNQTSTDCMHILSEKAFNKHEAAIHHYIVMLPWYKRIRLKKAWNKLAYHENDRNHATPFYEQYSDCGSLDKRRKVRPIVIRRISKILKLASS